jgi:predicted dehydrogenase
VAVIGVGALGEHHARIYADLPGVRLAGVCDVDANRARAIAERFGTSVFASLDEAAAGIDAASVVVPTNRHFEVAAELLRRGIHLLIEKPITSTTEEAERLVALADERGAILQVGHIERFNPVLAFLERQPHPPRFIETHRLAPYPPPRPDGRPRGTEVSVVLDLMIHDLEVILHLVGAPVDRLDAVGVPVLSGSEDIANVRLRFANGAVANVTASRISAERMRKIRVFYPDAYVSLDYMTQAGALHRIGPSGIERIPVPIERGEPLRHELRAFAECVARRAEPVVGGRQAAEALRLAVAAVRRMRESPS